MTTLIELIPPYDVPLDIDLFLYGHLVGRWKHHREYLRYCISESPEEIDFLLVPGEWKMK